MQNIERRQFIQRASLAVLGVRLAFSAGLSGISLILFGCNVFNDILNWVPVGQAAVTSILSVLTGNGVLINPAMQSIIALINAGFTALIAAIKEYQSTTPAPVGTIAKIQAAFGDVVDNFKTFLASLNVSGGLLAIVAGLAQVVFSTVAAFMNQLPAPVAALRTTMLASAVRVGGVDFAVIPKHRTRRAFKKDWNSTLNQGSSAGVVVPKSAYLHVTLFEHL
jgi:hypothetical protein